MFSGIPKGEVDSTAKPKIDTYPADHFGEMRQVSFKEGIVDMDKVLGKGNGFIDHAKLNPLLEAIGTKLIAVRVRLPEGTLMALAPLDNSVRQVVRWNIGKQTDLLVMCETVMFKPEQDNLRIDFGNKEFVALKDKPEVTVWITNEPRVRTRFDPADGFPGVQHFEHYYELLPDNVLPVDGDGSPLKPLPKLTNAAGNTDTPPCPGCRMLSRNPLG